MLGVIDNDVLLGFCQNVRRNEDLGNRLAKKLGGTPTPSQYRYLIALVFF
ncbi:hypothetical protein FTUN_0001 [Frigoriglobus tundricola]|uniref:Uncharacterized protein n=1 Tax=Frigoriglobus tundricola TaxID=2774151 RepID=A0A6M5YER5_9BACT|nr:hypothetical protein FTUN_0001 [Frigoriglobus tundricola]